MYVPLHYQVSEYDCVPVAFINAVCYLFERQEIPPMVIRHIYLYTLDTVGREARLGSRGTSRHAVRLLGHWLTSYKFKKFSVGTRFLLHEKVHLRRGNRIFSCLEQGGIALCNIQLGGQEEHYLMLIKVEDGWVHCFDPYFRTSIRGLQQNVRMLKNEDGRSANLKIRIEWMDTEERLRFCLGPIPLRECLLIWRNP